MARNRTLNPDLWTDDKVVQLSIGAELLYIGCISQADDEGRLEWNPRQLRGRLFGGREDVSLATVTQWMRELSAVKLLSEYLVDGTPYAFHPRWEKHQYINRKTRSKLPSPSGVRATLKRGEQPAPGLFTTTSVSENGVNSEAHVPSVSDSVSDSESELETVSVSVTAPAFADMEPDVEIFLAEAASENKTHRITEGRRASLRRDLADMLGKVGKAAFLHGLRAANAKGAPNVNYVRRAAENFKPHVARRSDDGPLPEYRRQMFDGKELKPIGGKR